MKVIKAIRKLQFRGDQLPDIDIDFPTSKRDVVKQYIQQRYGQAYTCSVGSYTRMKLKTCIKDFAKVAGLSFDYTNKITKSIDDQVEYSWGDLIRYATQSKALYKFVQQYPNIIHATKYALMACKAASIHPSAVVIVPQQDERGVERNVYNWTPIALIDGMLVSQWEGKYMDKGGFLKEDILGLNQLDKFRNIIQLVLQDTKQHIQLTNIPFDDEQVFRYFQHGWNEDVFQFGTQGLMQYSKQVKPKCLEDLIAITAIFRPATMEIGAHHTFAAIRAGKQKPKYDYGMEQITHDTLGIYIYQEQVMQAARIGSLTAVESDTMRTAIKKKKLKTLSGFQDKFISGYSDLLLQKGQVSDQEDATAEATAVWTKLLSFAGYGFNKSHAAAYSIISYWSQWLKVNYPLEFWTTSLQFTSSETEIPYRIAEMKRVNPEIQIAQPDVNYSGATFVCDPDSNRIYYSLLKINGVGITAVDEIVAVRQHGGRFFSVDEFISRVTSKVNKRVVVRLIVVGAFDDVEQLRHPVQRHALLYHYTVDVRGEVMPAEYDTVEARTTDSFWIMEQKRLTGFGDLDYASMIADRRLHRLLVTASDFKTIPLKSEVAIAGNLLDFTERSIKSGTMLTIHISSSNEILKCIIWPDKYDVFINAIGNNLLEAKNKVICISGVVEKDKFRNERVLYSNIATRVRVIIK